jgi:hypothetical protein
MQKINFAAIFRVLITVPKVQVSDTTDDATKNNKLA